VAAVQRWIDETYPLFRAQAQRAKAEIYWGDEMGMRSDHHRGTTYGLKGKTPVILGTGQRFRCNMISAITNRGKLYFMVYRQGFSSKVFLSFLKRLVKQVGRRFFSSWTGTRHIAPRKPRIGLRSKRKSPIVLSARIQSGTESRRDAEPGRQIECRGPKTTSQSIRDGAQCSQLSS